MPCISQDREAKGPAGDDKEIVWGAPQQHNENKIESKVTKIRLLFLVSHTPCGFDHSLLLSRSFSLWSEASEQTDETC